MNGCRAERLRSNLLVGSSLGTALLLLSPVAAVGNPAGGTVAAGSASIASAGRLLTVTQSSNRAIINWQQFSIGAGETTRFNLPAASAAILNRVTGGNPSVLLGRLSSNGQVYLINPSGVVVGPHGRINTATFVASTLDLPDAAFMRGGALRFSGGSTARIVNLGTIKTSAGDVALIALDVVNKGIIAAPNGQAILAAGGQVLYIPNGDSDVLIQPAGAPAGVTNKGVIAAAQVQLRAAGSAYALAVNNGGVVSATAVDEVGGRVVLDGGAGDVVSTGRIAASGPAGAGGAVTMTGGRIGVTGVVDASGPSHGGTITLVARNAITVTQSALLDADATQSGDGGHISVKASTATQFDGNASARGGPQGGNGGSAEISGGTLGFTGLVDLTAPIGRTGSLLFDPDSITIDSGSTPLPSGVLTSGFWNYTDNPGAQTVGAAAIVNALATTNLTLEANDSITVSAPIVSSSTNFLALNAPTVAIDADINLLNASLNFYGITSQVVADGPPVSTIGQSLTSASGATIAANTMVIDGYAQTLLSGPVKTGTLYVSQDALPATSFSAINAGNTIAAVSLGDGFGTADSYSGNFALSTTGPLTVEGMTNATGGVAITAAGNLTMSAADVTQTQLGSSGGQVTLASTGGAFINDVGTGLFGGTGRRVIYSATDGSGYSDGGLSYAVVNPVAYGSDPDSTATGVIYIASATLLPTLTITADAASRQYGLADPSFTASYSGGTSADLLTLPQFEVLGGPDSNVGAYTIQAYGAVANGYRIAYVTGTLDVTRAPLVIIPNLTSLYGASIPTTLPGSDFSGLLNGDTSLVLTTQPRLNTAATSASSVGTYGITASNAAAANYSISYLPGTLTIDPAPLLITPNVSRAYGGSLPGVLPGADFSGLVNGDTPASLTAQPTLNTNATAASGVGTYGITASGAAAANYTISYAAGTLSVTPAPLTIGIASATQTYGGTTSARFSYSGFVNNEGPANLVDPAAPFTSATVTSPVGNYSIVGTGAYSPNYQISYTPGTLTVSPASLTITPNLSFTYGGTLPASLPAADFAGFVNGDTSASLTAQPMLNTSATSGSSAGSYAITASGASAANYAISYAPGSVTVNKAPLVITPNISTVYGSGLPSSLPAVDFSGFVNGDSQAALTTQPALATAANASSPVGSYGITAGGAVAANYVIGYQPGYVSVTPAPLSIGAIGTQTYGGAPSVRYVYTGFVNGDSAASLTTQPSFTTGATATSLQGTYSLTTFGAADPNYNISYRSGEMFVTTAPLVVTANNLSRNYGQVLAGSLSYSGFVNGDSPFTVFSRAPQTGDDPVTRTPGGYAENIVPGIQVNPGYSVSYVTGSVTVTPAPLAIAANAAAMPYGGTLPALTGTFNGLVLGDQPWNSGYSFAVDFPSSGPTPGRTYPISLVGSNPNYTVTYTPGSLTVGSATLTALPTTIVDTSSPLTLTSPNNPDTPIDTSVQTTNQSVTVNVVTINPTFDWAGLGNSAMPEETAIVQQYVAVMAGSDPPVTLASVEAQLAGDGAASLTMKATLMPLIYAQLQAILDEPQSQWTPDEAAFVSGMQNFITEQRQQAAIQAENAYATWQQQQQDIEEQKLAGLTGPAYTEMASILASNPPVPPSSFIQLAEGGTALTPQQSIAKLGIGVAASAITNSAQQIEQQKVQAEMAWMQADASDPQAQVALSQFANKLNSSDPTTVTNAELALDSAYQSASGSNNPAGFSAGTVSDAGKALWLITYGMTGSPAGALKSVVRALGPGLARVIFPKDVWGRKIYARSRTNGDTSSSNYDDTSSSGKSSSSSDSSSESTEIANMTNEVEQSMEEGEKTAQAAGSATSATADIGANAAKTGAGVAEEVAEVTGSLSEVLETAGDFLGPLGLALELAGNVTQAVTGAVEYGQVAQYNLTFSQAVNAANAPVTVADLKSMMSANNSTGQSQMMNYISSAMAVGDASPPAETATKSLTALVNYGY